MASIVAVRARLIPRAISAFDPRQNHKYDVSRKSGSGTPGSNTAPGKLPAEQQDRVAGLLIELTGKEEAPALTPDEQVAVCI
jgi:hypothetical protein